MKVGHRLLFFAFGLIFFFFTSTLGLASHTSRLIPPRIQAVPELRQKPSGSSERAPWVRFFISKKAAEAGAASRFYDDDMLAYVNAIDGLKKNLESSPMDLRE